MYTSFGVKAIYSIILLYPLIILWSLRFILLLLQGLLSNLGTSILRRMSVRDRKRNSTLFLRKVWI